MLALGMDDVVLSVQSAPVDDIVRGVLAGGELHRRIGDSGHIVGMCVTVHVVVHDIVGIFTVGESEQTEEAVGKQKRHNVFVDELIDRQRRNRHFHRGFLLR